MPAAKVILIDIETSPNVAYTWGAFDQNVIAFDREWEVLSVAWKELGKKQVYAVSRPDFDDKTDKELVLAVWKVLDEADVLIGHNIDKFDSPKLRAKFIQYGLKPPSPYKTIDTIKIARSQFRFNRNRLSDLAFTLNLGRKVKTGGIDLWFDCWLANKPEAWKKMVKYNKHDVVLLERVYYRLAAWYPNHPNLAIYDEDGEYVAKCPTCNSTKVHRRGFHVMKTRKAARFQCQQCGAWFHKPLG